MKQKYLLILASLVFLLSGCNLPGREKPAATPTEDVLATEVQKLLTPSATSDQAQAANTETPLPVASATATTASATETPAPSPTAPATLTATLNPGDPAASLGKPSWKDTLDSTKNFYLYENDNTRIEAGDGTLKLTSVTAVGWVGWTLTYVQKPANFYLEGVFKSGDCSGKDLYGLVFRASKENAGYFFGVTCDGNYNLYARDFNNNTNAEIRSYQANSAILQGGGQTNRIGVLANGDKLSLFVNGVLLEDIQDGTYSSGYFGAFVAGNATSGFTAEMDEITLWNIE